MAEHEEAQEEMVEAQTKAAEASEAKAELNRALEFHRRVRAERYIQEGEALLAVVG